MDISFESAVSKMSLNCTKILAHVHQKADIKVVTTTQLVIMKQGKSKYSAIEDCFTYSISILKSYYSVMEKNEVNL